MMISRSVIVTLALYGLVLASDADELRYLFDVTCSAGPSTVYQAKKSLLSAYRSADEPCCASFTPELIAALSQPARQARITAAQALAVRPDEDAVAAMLGALTTEADPLARWALVRSLAASIQKLAEPPRQTAVAETIGVFERLIRADDTEPQTRNLLAVSLGQLGPQALPALRALRADRRTQSLLHSVLPAAFAATGTGAACADLMDMYDSDSSIGFRIGCLHAMGALLKRADDSEYQHLAPLLDALRAAALNSRDPRLASAACLAYSCWPRMDDVAEIIGAIHDGVRTTNGDDQKRYLRALLKSDRPLDEQMRTFLEGLSTSSAVSAIHLQIAAAILEKHVAEH